MDSNSAKIKINRWLIVLILGLTLGFSYEPPYIRYTFHEQLTSICGYTDTQLGLMLSVYGTVALIFYIIGGVSADKYSCRTLIVISLLGTAFGCAVMAFYPPFWVALGVEALFVVTTIGLLWSPVYKVAALLGSQKEQGKILPMVSSFEGVGAFITTLSCTFIFSKIGGEANYDSLRIVWLVYAAWGVLLAVCTYLFVPAKTLYSSDAAKELKKENVTVEEKASRKKEHKSVLVAVLTNKMTYIASFVVLGSYITYSCLTYTQSWLCDIYGMDATTASYFSIVRNQVMKIVAGPLSVVLMSTAVLKSSPTRLCTVTGILSAIGIAATMMMPSGNALLPVLMGISIILSLFALLGKAQNFACTGETGVDPKIFGTMTGIVSLLGYSSDTWIYAVIGRWQETLAPAAAYNRVFILAIVGCIMMVAAGALLLASIKKGHKVEA